MGHLVIKREAGNRLKGRRPVGTVERTLGSPLVRGMDDGDVCSEPAPGWNARNRRVTASGVLLSMCVLGAPFDSACAVRMYSMDDLAASWPACACSTGSPPPPEPHPVRAGDETIPMVMIKTTYRRRPIRVLPHDEHSSRNRFVLPNRIVVTGTDYAHGDCAPGPVPPLGLDVRLGPGGRQVELTDLSGISGRAKMEISSSRPCQ